uniref:Uncharacterized protein n=1 Tax=Romanomermis culicivorax TaxID=13658 RepID=A0A915L1R0_ROMCU
MREPNTPPERPIHNFYGTPKPPQL